MGRVRTKTVKKSSRQVIEKYYYKMTLDFHTNKKILEEVAIKTDLIEFDKETLDMLSALGMSDLPGVVKQAAEPQAVAALPTYGRGAGGFGRKYY
ncbi:PREDICTED: 40S ribosomal protein S17-like [Nicotiana attenuata]|uniref:40s ribosomal protein s17 n=1 Tax=Nicotiana attenuata TaxID=49451 RepID=A0A1J6HXX9_NICAT|nr:PREDICTED: 40S ribosomal protein S17-like [Nicotiana attenuata]OIS97693.1 40s ribosomal protein s17 [Nicotiana attenuata]